jgi:hypothetical protein
VEVLEGGTATEAVGEASVMPDGTAGATAPMREAEDTIAVATGAGTLPIARVTGSFHSVIKGNLEHGGEEIVACS